MRFMRDGKLCKEIIYSILIHCKLIQKRSLRFQLLKDSLTCGQHHKKIIAYATDELNKGWNVKWIPFVFKESNSLRCDHLMYHA